MQRKSLETTTNTTTETTVDSKKPEALIAQSEISDLLNHPLHSTEEVISKTEIGSGSTCVVFSAFYQNKPVALKEFVKREGEDQYADFFKKSFINEIRMLVELARLQAPNIIRLYAFNLIAPNMSMTLELMPRTYFDVLAKNESSVIEKFMVLQQICNALAFLHKNEIVHKDLKPNNILVDEAYHASLCDFGMASKITSPSDHCYEGSVGYRAPEIVLTRSCPYAYASDIYSFGVVFFQSYKFVESIPGVTANDSFDMLVKMEHFMHSNHLRKPIPDFVPPVHAAIMKQCMLNDISKRPSASILNLFFKQEIEAMQPSEEVPNPTSPSLKRCQVETVSGLTS